MTENKHFIDYQNDPKYKLSDLEVPSSFLNVNKTLQRMDYSVPGARVFSIPFFFSASECKKLIELTEGIGYKDVGNLSC